MHCASDITLFFWGINLFIVAGEAKIKKQMLGPKDKASVNVAVHYTL